MSTATKLEGQNELQSVRNLLPFCEDELDEIATHLDGETALSSLIGLAEINPGRASYFLQLMSSTLIGLRAGEIKSADDITADIPDESHHAQVLQEFVNRKARRASGCWS